MTNETTEFSYLDAQAAALGVESPTVARVHLTLADGRELSALRFGVEEPVALFLHGAGLNAHTWDATILSLGLPALAIDLAGHGDSSWRSDANYSPTTLADDIAQACRAWTTRPQIFVGHSLGGLAAAALAARHPEFVAQLVIVDITPGVDMSAGPAMLRQFFAGPTDFASREELVNKAMQFGLGGSHADTERGVFLNTRVRDDGRVEWKHHFAHIAAQALDNQNDDVPALLSEQGWHDLAAVRAPITLVRALHGFVTPDDAAEFARRVPRAIVTALDATHNAQETAYNELAALVRARYTPEASGSPAASGDPTASGNPTAQ
ncbi:alpha/beta fold hydrolase [Microbacterium sp. YY-01]|uniref:alpha/beta fold hydrolase n=1 Tax=Microbacterium sp. YY-01 TaxID=3421634 RepID=UPI003D16C108